MGTSLYAGVAGHALRIVEGHFTIDHRKRMYRTLRDAVSAVNAELPGLGVVTVAAVEVASLKKDRCPVPWSIDR